MGAILRGCADEARSRDDGRCQRSGLTSDDHDLTWTRPPAEPGQVDESLRQAADTVLQLVIEEDSRVGITRCCQAEVIVVERQERELLFECPCQVGRIAVTWAFRCYVDDVDAGCLQWDGDSRRHVFVSGQLHAEMLTLSARNRSTQASRSCSSRTSASSLSSAKASAPCTSASERPNSMAMASADLPRSL